MNFDFKKLKLSGKGIKVSQAFEWLDDNFKLTTENTVFHEVLLENDGTEQRIGWISPDKIQLQIDFTTHTNQGMVGESVQNELNSFLIVDFNNRFGQNLVNELIDVNSEETQVLLDKYSKSRDDRIFSNVDFRTDENEGSVFIISIPQKLVFIQSPVLSIKIGDNGVFVLEREKDTLTLVSESNGITIIDSGKSKVEINDKQHIRINGKEFNPHSIINHVTNSIAHAFSDLRF